MQINVTRSSLPDFEEYCNEIKDLWETHWLTNMGIKHKTFQEELESFFDIPHVSLYTNGHLALEGIWETLDLKKGGEVITSPYTFASTTHSIVRNGLTPVFCDIKSEDCTIDESKIESLITENTVAICPVHVYGNVCNVEEIGKIAGKHNLKVIYDAAHAFGVRYKGISVANIGDMVMFSFHATKAFHTIEGGCICFRDDDYLKRTNELKNFGIHGPDSVQYIGGNAKMSEFQAAMGICNLRHFYENVSKREKIDRRYRKNLSGISGIRLLTVQTDLTPNYSYFPVLFEDYKYSRDTVYERLAEQGIIARKYFYPLTSSYECYKGFPGVDPVYTPVALHIADHVLTLPIYADLTEDEVDRICSILMN